MISLGIAELVLLGLFIIMLVLVVTRRAMGISLLVAVALVVVFSERMAPGTLASIGNAIHGIDQVDYAGPHFTIGPIVGIGK